MARSTVGAPVAEAGVPGQAQRIERTVQIDGGGLEDVLVVAQGGRRQGAHHGDGLGAGLRVSPETVADLVGHGLLEGGDALADRPDQVAVAHGLARLGEPCRLSEQSGDEEAMAADLAAVHRLDLRVGQGVAQSIAPRPLAIEGAREHVHGAARQRQQQRAVGPEVLGRRADRAVAADHNQHVERLGLGLLDGALHIGAKAAPDAVRRDAGSLEAILHAGLGLGVATAARCVEDGADTGRFQVGELRHGVPTRRAS